MWTTEDDVRKYTASLTGGCVMLAGWATSPLTGIVPSSLEQATSAAASVAETPPATRNRRRSIRGTGSGGIEAPEGGWGVT